MNRSSPGIETHLNLSEARRCQLLLDGLDSMKRCRGGIHKRQKVVGGGLDVDRTHAGSLKTSSEK